MSSTDGVGTKLKIAMMMNRHNTVGADLVNHCINDILVQGAKPLFFMDYFATGKLDPDVIVSVVEGVANGCKDAGSALLGGETAEMPGFYADGDYDIAGFIVGVVDRSKILDGKSIRHGDVLIGLPSVGLHTNGYSLARKLFFEIAGLTRRTPRVEGLDGTVGEELLKPHVNYEPVLRKALAAGLVEGLAHITGGGITENLDRILPQDCEAQFSWDPGRFCLSAGRWRESARSNRWKCCARRTWESAWLSSFVLRMSNAFLATLETPHYPIGQIIPGEPRVTYRA